MQIGNGWKWAASFYEKIQIKRSWKWTVLLYGFFVIGFVDVNYKEMAQFLNDVSTPAQAPRIAGLVRRTQATTPTTVSTTTTTAVIICGSDSDCNKGTCVIDSQGNASYCECDIGYKSLNTDGQPATVACSYKQLTSLAALLISIFAGLCGVDWCYLSKGNGCYICLGVLKGLTLAGVGIWGLVDIIRVAVYEFPDGNGVALKPF